MSKVVSVFAIPGDLKRSLSPYVTGKIEEEPASVEPAAPVKASFGVDGLDEGGATCSYCGLIPNASTKEEMRSHFRKDYHKYNIKRRLKGLAPMSEDEFETAIGDLDESISGSEDEESDAEEEEEDAQIRVQKSTPFVLYKSTSDGRIFGVYRALYREPQLEKGGDLLGELNAQGKSAIVMIGGGHFSAAIIQHSPMKGQAPTHTNPYAHIKVIASKTFHRYTTRRKQGGSQSASDNARGKANSAGSSLRRYNEQALQQEVRELLSSWREELANCDGIYIRANGNLNKGVIMNYDDKAPIQGRDARVHSLPFTTRRATATEIKRAWVELSSLHVVQLPKTSGTGTPKAPLEHKKKAESPKPVAREPTAEEKHSAEIASLVKKSRAPRLVAYFKANKLSVDFALEPHSQYSSTPNALFLASSAGMHHIVTTLLLTLGADPTIPLSDTSSKRAFDVAKDQATRDAFQLARAKLGEAKWDWKLSHIGPAITKEDIELRQEQEKKAQEDERRKMDEALKIKLQEEKKMKQNANETLKRPPGKKLGSSVVTTVGDTSLRGLSDEAKMRLERERRARAAEARFKKLQG
ncbi:tRNA endonuclease Vms1p [Trichomonascus vanleenenianus]|uniref:Vms1p n=1 Tax=Trichomonascus vanleenenianus TaxID=2268995 RepID=UPI003ECAA060